MNLRSRLVFVGGLAALSLASPGCRGENASSSAGETRSSVDSMGIAPTGIVATPIRTTRNLRESSALAMSRDQPGVMFTINDSGNEPVLFAIDTAGADRGAWTVQKARNVDWEAVAIGSCGVASSSARCVYIGDVGDNDARHPTRSIYRVAEPPARDASFSGAVTAEHVTFTYPDQPHDVEAMYAAANGDLLLITKRAQLTASRRLRPALVFRIPARAWISRKDLVADLFDSLSIVPGSAPFRVITDASLSPDGQHVAIRTYSQLFVYGADSMTGRINASAPPAICNLVPLGEAQGEGVTWLASSGRFAFSSEGRAAPLHLATCPLPH